MPIIRKNSTSATSALMTAFFRMKPNPAVGSALAGGGAGTAIRQTFSTSGRPSRPVGMKISTMIRIENAATSLYSTEK